MSSDLIGTWSLTAFEITFEDDRPSIHAMGEGARGRLVYAADGHVLAVLGKADRANLGVGGLETAHRATDAAKARAFDSYMSYAGRYRIEGTEIIHTVEMALTPDVVGLEQRREIQLDGDTLTLTYTIEGARGPHRRILTWTRAEAS